MICTKPHKILIISTQKLLPSTYKVTSDRADWIFVLALSIMLVYALATPSPLHSATLNAKAS